MNHRVMLKKQVGKVIEYFEKNYLLVDERGIVKLIYERYLNADKILDNEVINLTDLHLEGGVRAYMDSYSDYENPVLEEMDKAEKLLKQMELEKQLK